MSSKVVNLFGYLLATLFGVGKAPVAPGTFGSLVAILPLVFWQPSIKAMSAMVVVSFLLGIWATGLAEAFLGTKDPGQIVIDELCGVWVAILTCYVLARYWNGGTGLVLIKQLPLGLNNAFATRKVVFHNSIYLTAIFVIFRICDILKPFPIYYFDKHVKGGLGVMLDDFIAGIMTGVIVYAIGFLW